MTYTNDQQDAINGLHKFVNGDALACSLIGPAGTGKTTVIKAITDAYSSCGVSAPTHKAKTVISKVTGRQGETLQSLLGLRPDVDLEDFNPNKPAFAQVGEPRIGLYKRVPIDEASMLNKDLLALLLIEAAKKNTKLIFIGDECQLPPVGENHSPALHQEISFKLTEPVRQQPTNPLTYLLLALRSDINTILYGINLMEEVVESLESFGLMSVSLLQAMNIKPDSLFRVIINFIPEHRNINEGFIVLKDEKLFNHLVAENFACNKYLTERSLVVIDESTKSKISVAPDKYISFTNPCVGQANHLIRSAIQEGVIDDFVVGDVIMGYRNISLNRKNLITNSQEYEVTYARQANFNWQDKEGIEYPMKGTFINLKTDDDLFESDDVFVVHEDSYESYMAIVNSHINFAKTRGGGANWKPFYDFTSKFVIHRDMNKYKGKFNQVYSHGDYRSKDIDYGYAITTHKSQGSTYNNIFVNVKDMYICLRQDAIRNGDLSSKLNFYKMLYTAISRSSKFATILL